MKRIRKAYVLKGILLELLFLVHFLLFSISRAHFFLILLLNVIKGLKIYALELN